MRAHESLWLRAFLEVAVTYGWRKRSILKMRVANVDFISNRMRQEASTTKAGQANEVKMTPSVRTLLTALCQGKDSDRFIFSRDEEGYRPIVDFRLAWDRATKAAGVPELLVHDLCRTASRRMRDAGIVQTERMKIMGRKTDSIDRRYDIVDQRDKDAAIDRLVQHSECKRMDVENNDTQIDTQSRIGAA